MLGLLTKDLLCLKKIGLKMLIIITLYAVIFSVGNSFSVLSTMIVVLSTILVLNTFAYDEMAKWDLYALSLPVTKKQIVMSKYLLTAVFDFAGIFVSSLICLVSGKWDADVPAGMLAIFSSALILASLLLPLLYKFGTQKARIWLILIFLLPTAVLMLLESQNIHLFSNMATMSNTEFEIITYLMLPISFLLYVGSYSLSYHIFQNKEI